MKIYLGDWLTNASMVGYLRIQKCSGLKSKNEDDHIEITEKDLLHFTDAYFVVVLEQYMQNSFVINSQQRNQLEPKDIQLKKQFRSKVDTFVGKQQLGKFDYTSYKKTAKNQVTALNNYKKNLKKFLAEMQKEFGIKAVTANSVLKANNKKIDGTIDAISSTSQKFLPNTLRRFYFNKGTVGNYSISKKTSRYDEFKEKYVMPAIATLKDPSRDGHVTCKICKQNKVYIRSFDENLLNETMFSPTMVSSSTFGNFFYNGQSDLFVCSVCELLLLCSWAGFNPIPIQVRDDISQTDNIFLNMPDVALSLKHNNAIKNNSKQSSYRFKDTIYSETIQKILVDRQRKKSSWILDNIFFVEIKTVSRKDTGKPDFRYYNITKNIAYLFADDMAAKALSYIQGVITHNGTKVNLVTLIINHILAGKPLDGIIHLVSVKALEEKRSRQLLNICLISSIRNVINLRHRGEFLNTTLQSKTIYGSLHGLQENGSILAQKINSSKKTKSISFVLLEAIRNNNIAKFYDIISKLYITNNLAIPEGMVDILNRNDAIRPRERGYAFLSGFSSNRGDSDE